MLGGEFFAYTPVFPAHAGVILFAGIDFLRLSRFPRTRGGDPKTLKFLKFICRFSPHTRG